MADEGEATVIGCGLFLSREKTEQKDVSTVHLTFWYAMAERFVFCILYFEARCFHCIAF